MLEEHDGEIALIRRPPVGSVEILAMLKEPWAVDSNGSPLETEYRVAGNKLVQRILVPDGYRGEVLFDPTYLTMPCVAHHARGTAFDYLIAERCPITIMFYKRHGYLPVWGSQTSVANDYGGIAVKQSGECDVIWDTLSGVYDFQVPCKAHDYCFDLRRAGFSGRVLKGDCDDIFLDLMLADCNDRNIVSRAACVSWAQTARTAVGPFPADPSPASFQIVNWNSHKCANVAYASGAEGTPIIQYTCAGSGFWNDKFTFWPDPDPFYSSFHRIVAAHSGMCAAVEAYTGLLWQYYCISFNNRQYLLDAYVSSPYEVVIRSYFHLAYNGCWDVPYSSTADWVQLIEYTCYGTDNQVWYLI